MIRVDNIFIAQGKILQGRELRVNPQQAASCVSPNRPFSLYPTQAPFVGTHQKPYSKYFASARFLPQDGDGHGRKPGLMATDINRSKDSRPPQPSSRTTTSNKGRSARPSNRRSSRRGFDVLEEIMYSQARSSNALLEKLQSTIAHGNDDNVSGISGGGPPPRRGNPFSRNGVDVKEGVMAQSLSRARGKDAGKPPHELPTEFAPTSSSFASSIGKALRISPDAESNGSWGSTASQSTAFLQENISRQALKAEVSDIEKPSLSGQEVLWALQKAASEKKLSKRKARKVQGSVSKSKEATPLQQFGDWRNAKPIILKQEWAMQIDELERRMEELRNPMSLMSSS